MKIKDKYLFIFLTVFILFFFKNSINIQFFADDFFFLKISNVKNIGDFLYFFYPIKDYFFRPIATELFYFVIHFFRESIFVAKLIVFTTYLIGLFFAYKSIQILTKNFLLSFLTIFLFSIHLTHVFQLYWLATYQEIALFTFLAVSLYSFLVKKYNLSYIFFLSALLSKETALFFPFLILLISLIDKKNFEKVRKIQVAILFFTSIAFFLFYQHNLSKVSEIQIYALNLSPKLVINNFIWYFLFSWGVANFLPLYFVSLLKPPISKFWELFRIFDFKIYFPLLVTYLIVFLAAVVRLSWNDRKTFIKIVVIFCLSLFGFALFLLPALPILHRWMVRLTIPLIFISFFQAYILFLAIKKSNFLRKIAVIILGLYISWNFVGVRLHENSSLYLLESRFVNNINKFFNRERATVIKYPRIFFMDRPPGMNDPWGGSEKLKNTLHDSSFLDHYLPGTSVTAIYNIDYIPACPRGAYILKSSDILESKGVVK